MNFSMKNKKIKKSIHNSKGNFFKSFFIISFLSMAMLFTGCQDEVNEIVQGANEEELLVANSSVASLMKSTATKDGSKDNIIDNASCFTVQLPVNVYVNGLEIIVDSEEDFETIEEIFDEYYDDEDYLEYAYPIVIELSDYTEVIIENKEQFKEYVEACENTEDDDIECVDFKYPLFYSVFDSNRNTIETVEIENDRQMFRFIKNIQTTDIISLNFPITVMFTDDTEMIINSMSELESALESGIEFCDEDDDNDYGDDDFDENRLEELLTMCPWIVHDLKRNNTDLTAEYKEYLIVFRTENVVKIRKRNGVVIEGSWNIDASTTGVKINLEFDSNVLEDFTLVWKVTDINHGRIKLYTEFGNRIILEKKCDLVFDHNKERIKNILNECLWRITRLHYYGLDYDQKYIGTPLRFFENGIVKLRIKGELIYGQWDIISPTQGTTGEYILILGFGDRPELNLYWRINLLGDEKIKLSNENSQLILDRFCENPDEDVEYINNVLVEGEWTVAKYETENGNIANIFENYIVGFKENGKIYGEGNGQNIFGSWLGFRNLDGHLKLGLNFGDNDPFMELNHRWKIVEITENRIELKDYSHSGTIERILVFERY